MQRHDPALTIGGRIVSGASFADHFSSVAAGYAAYRPTYPPPLFDRLAHEAPNRDVAWDCACGTGQATLALAERFTRVEATDASADQIANAVPHSRVRYRVAQAHQSGLPDASVSLITVAQALHWFDVDAFHAEARRVLVPGGVIAEWCYTLLEVPKAPDVGRVVNGLDAQLKQWWPAQRALVDARYEPLGFPFTRIVTEPFDMTADWTIEQLVGYVATWSAVTRYRAAHGDDVLNDFTSALRSAWGGNATHTIRWPLVLRMGRG